MPSMFSSFSKAVSQTFDTVADVAESTQMTVGMATTFIDNRAKKQMKVDRVHVINETVKELLEIKKELDSDAEARALFETLDKDW